MIWGKIGWIVIWGNWLDCDMGKVGWIVIWGNRLDCDMGKLVGL